MDVSFGAAGRELALRRTKSRHDFVEGPDFGFRAIEWFRSREEAKVLILLAVLALESIHPEPGSTRSQTPPLHLAQNGRR